MRFVDEEGDGSKRKPIGDYADQRWATNEPVGKYRRHRIYKIGIGALALAVLLGMGGVTCKRKANSKNLEKHLNSSVYLENQEHLC